MADMNVQAPNVAIPTTDARKLLIIGLGSTGAKVCNQVLERLSWTYNSPNNVPWLRTLVLDTEEVDSSRLVCQYGESLHLKIDRTQYAALISNPNNYQANMDFPSWNIPAMTGGTLLQSGVTSGANNNRVLGRIALLYPNNINALRSSIVRILDDLGRLQDQEASARFSDGYGSPMNVELSGDVHVYVVGTLCGGTSSGGFIDLGYLLQSLEGYRVTPSGIFMLPSMQQANQNRRMTANAYAALVELNHYSSEGSHYAVQYPWRAGTPWSPPVSGVAPYDHCYLLQTRGASNAEYAKLMTAAADYVYAEAIGSSAAIRDGARTNITDYFIQRDYWGATQKFFSFGLSVIEFPLAKVMKACTVRLACRAFEMLAGGDGLTAEQQANLAKQVPLLDRKTLVKRLLTRGNDDLFALVRQQIVGAHRAGLISDDALRTVRGRLDAAFGEGSARTAEELPAQVVPLTIDTNKGLALNELTIAITEGAKELISGPQMRGLRGLVSYLEGLKTVIEKAQADDLGAKPADPGRLKQDMNTALDHLAECRTHFFLGVVGQRPASIRRYVDEFISLAQAHYEKRLYLACAPACQEIYTEILSLVDTLLRRLNEPGIGLTAEIARINNLMKEYYNRIDVVSGTSQDGWERLINGKELFTPNHTVEVEYSDALQDAGRRYAIKGDWKLVERAMALRCAAAYVNKAVGDLFANPMDVRRFDQKPGRVPPQFDDARLLALADVNREVFSSIKNRSLLDRLLSEQNPAGELDEANRNASEFLNWNNAHPRFFADPRKSYGFVFYNHADPQAGEFHQLLTQRRIVDGTAVRAISVADRNQMMILKEIGAYSLGTVVALDDDIVSEWRLAYEDTQTIASHHSRGDVEEWFSWVRTDTEHRRRVRALYLVAVALGIVEHGNGGNFVFKYPPKSPADKGVKEFSNDLNVAAQQIRKGGYEGNINVRVRDVRSTTPDATFIARIVALIRDRTLAFREGDRVLTEWEVQGYLLDYIMADVNLRDVYNRTFRDPVIAACEREEGGRTAYFCPNCRVKLGYIPDVLYMYERGIPVRKCCYCKKDIDAFVGQMEAVAQV